jgi:hypothetical protein
MSYTFNVFLCLFDVFSGCYDFVQNVEVHAAVLICYIEIFRWLKILRYLTEDFSSNFSILMMSLGESSRRGKKLAHWVLGN